MATKVEKMVIDLIEQIIMGENESIVSYDGNKHRADEIIETVYPKETSFEISLSDGTRFTLSVSEVQEPVFHLYRAVLSDERPLVTVRARSYKEAADKLTDELTKNPSRVPYYELWKSHGCLITED